MHSHHNAMERISSLLVAFFYGFAMVIMFWYSDPSAGSRNVVSLLAWWIQYTVLSTGFILLVLTLLQTLGLGRRAEAAPAGEHAHEHHEGCSHDHHHEHDHNHDHAHNHEKHDSCGHAHLDHSHGHAHDHGDHEHGWVPIRFVPLVVPLLLCLMGLPNERMVRAYENALIERNASGDDGQPLRVSSLNHVIGTWNLGTMSLSAGLTHPGCLPLAFGTTPVAQVYDNLEWENWDDSIKPLLLDLDMLERVAESRSQHEEWRKKPSVEVEGMLYLGPKTQEGTKQWFRIVRLRVACCLGDASPATVDCLYRFTIDDKNRLLKQNNQEPLKSGDWVAIRGRLDFFPRKGKYVPFMRVYEVEKRPIPPRPYL